MLNGPLGRHQIDAVSRQAIGQANINTEEIRSLLVPVPPLNVQEDLVAMLNDARTHADALLSEATALHTTAMAEVDAMIQGTMPVPKE